MDTFLWIIMAIATAGLIFWYLRKKKKGPASPKKSEESTETSDI